jgi:molybdenum cofactor guanylyltransferase
MRADGDRNYTIESSDGVHDIPVRFSSAAVLAGGASRRMGGIDKQFLRAGERTLAEIVMRRVGSIFSDIVIVTRKPEAYTGCPDHPMRAVRDILPGSGPLSGLHTALSVAKSEWLYLAACDTPFFSPDWVHCLIEKIEAAELSGIAPMACMASFGGHEEPFHAFYSKSLLPNIEGLLNKRDSAFRAPSLVELLDGLPEILVPESEVRGYSEDYSLFFNINSPDDWNSYLQQDPEFAGAGTPAPNCKGDLGHRR